MRAREVCILPVRASVCDAPNDREVRRNDECRSNKSVQVANKPAKPNSS